MMKVVVVALSIVTCFLTIKGGDSFSVATNKPFQWQQRRQRQSTSTSTIALQLLRQQPRITAANERTLSLDSCDQSIDDCWMEQRHHHDDTLLGKGEHQHQPHQRRRRNVLQSMSGMVVAAITTWTQPPSSFAATTTTTKEDFLNSLKNATADQPPIPLPRNYNTLQTAPFVVEGLLSVPKKNQLLSLRDVIYIEVTTVSEPDVVLLAAKLPVIKVTEFPVRFRLDERNLVKSQSQSQQQQQEEQQQQTKDEPDDRLAAAVASDWMVRAFVIDCPPPGSGDGETTKDTSDSQQQQPSQPTSSLSESTSTSMCLTPVRGQTPRLETRGVAKLLRLEDQKTTIRAPVSLMFQ